MWNNTFLRFAFGFLGLIVLSIGIILSVGAWGKQSSGSAVSAVGK